LSQKAKRFCLTSPCWNILSNTGLTPPTAMAGKPSPRMPSNRPATNANPGSCGWVRVRVRVGVRDRVREAPEAFIGLWLG